ncbi:hypothetical protein [Accumulibacter sp.]|uniref:Uncharacterized protein n=1 Tax=Accumulibacter regalis TaxID=522306 RepID=C7RVM4_ACCRE|nr:hypothetical protein [Accumulibacter sp.]MBN8497998.1 hypothetical protein [Accumulibacter sp.]MBO3716452.1 hypothetical protein [Accumulibacter sp.]
MTTFTSRTCPSQFMGRPGCRVAEPRSLMAAAGDRLSGGLCAELPGGRCRLAMVRDQRWERIEASLA